MGLVLSQAVAKQRAPLLLPGLLRYILPHPLSPHKPRPDLSVARMTTTNDNLAAAFAQEGNCSRAMWPHLPGERNHYYQD